ncbi:MAG: hypothetical protein IKE43_09105 [Coriobacteriales bacterium]|nr:hypothetical protein [Coriobacteriales bacterium]
MSTRNGTRFANQKKSTGKTVLKWCLIVFGVLTVISVIAYIINPDAFSKQQTANQTTGSQTTQSDSQIQAAVKVPPTEIKSLQFGDLLSVIDNGYGTVVIKAKVNSQLTNKQTIDQNYYNACDFIRHADLTGIDEVQYWAVADTSDGDEIKIISFSIPRDVINMIQNTDFPDNTLSNYIQNDDFFILGSLL